MRHGRFLIALLLLAPIAAAWGQQPPPIKPGARVRVTAPNAGIKGYIGTLLALPTDTLVVDSLRLAVAGITRLDFSRGSRSKAGRGALIGGGVGIVTGAIAGFLSRGLCYGAQGGCPAATTAVGAGSLGLVGAGIGTLIGGSSESERWEEVPLAQLPVSIVPLRDHRISFTLSLQF